MTHTCNPCGKASAVITIRMVSNTLHGPYRIVIHVLSANKNDNITVENQKKKEERTNIRRLGHVVVFTVSSFIFRLAAHVSHQSRPTNHEELWRPSPRLECDVGLGDNSDSCFLFRCRAYLLKIILYHLQSLSLISAKPLPLGVFTHPRARHEDLRTKVCTRRKRANRFINHPLDHSSHSSETTITPSPASPSKSWPAREGAKTEKHNPCR